MYSRILIATDGSDLAGQAVDHGLRLAKALGASVVIVTVTEFWSALEMAQESRTGRRDVIQHYEAAAAQSARMILDDAARRAEAAGVAHEERHVPDARPAEGIMDTAELESCDLIVMASHGRRGIQRMLIGSQTAEVIALSKTPVLVLR